MVYVRRALLSSDPVVGVKVTGDGDGDWDAGLAQSVMYVGTALLSSVPVAGVKATGKGVASDA